MNELTVLRQRRMRKFLLKKENDPTRRMFQFFKSWKPSYIHLYIPQIGMTVGSYFVYRYYAKEIEGMLTKKRKRKGESSDALDSPAASPPLSNFTSPT